MPYCPHPYSPGADEQLVLQQLLFDQTNVLMHSLQQTQEALLASLSLMAAYRDGGTGAHINRTGWLMTVLARAYGQVVGQPFSEQYICVLSRSAPLHDIGKVSIPDAILRKPGALNADELKLIQQHPAIGGAILRQVQQLSGDWRFLQTAIDITECHHEHYDGSGYPKGLSGDSIPLSAQLMAVADIYDALVTLRPYKRALSHETAVDILLHGDGRTQTMHFSPAVLGAFERCEPSFRVIHAGEWTS